MINYSLFFTNPNTNFELAPTKFIGKIQRVYQLLYKVREFCLSNLMIFPKNEGISLPSPVLHCWVW